MHDKSMASKTKRASCSGDVSGVILAGGKSSRYGKNKAFAEIDGIPIIERVATVLQKLFKDITIISNTPEDYKHLGFPIIQDIVKGLGPIGGIFTALSQIPCRYFFIAACDMPSLNEGLIRHMVSLRNKFDIIAPKIAWKIEALHALYSRDCLPHIKELV